MHSSWLNWLFTKESYAVAHPLFRERYPSVEVRPGQTPAHSQPLIPYTTTRDTILSRATGRHWSPALLWANPTIGGLAERVVVGGALPEGPEESIRSSAQGDLRSGEPVAVVGMACRFPGADGVEGFWNLLEAGVDAVRDVPEGRWEKAAWLHQFKRLCIRYERRADLHQGLLELACSLICLRHLRT